MTCGEGVETRVVTCVDQDNNVVDDASCVAAQLPRPEETRVCFLRECTTYSYFVGVFGQVST